MIYVDNLHKQYGRVEALSGLTFSVNEGEIYGIIGPDGAGKTSLFRILATLLLPDGGRAEVDGLDVVKDIDWTDTDDNARPKEDIKIIKATIIK